MSYPKLNFPPIELRARHNANGRTEVFDKIRGRWLVLTPEEWVRRHVVGYLLTACGFTEQQIVEEYPVNINGLAQRADIVAIGSNQRPLVVVECKEPSVKIDHGVLSQAVRYNSVLGCRYVVLTNGIETFTWHCSSKGYTPIGFFPHFE